MIYDVKAKLTSSRARAVLIKRQKVLRSQELISWIEYYHEILDLHGLGE